MNNANTNQTNAKDARLCEICGMGHTREERIDEVIRYEGLEAVVPDYLIFVCDTCGEATVDPESVKRAEPIVCDLHRRGEGMFTSDEIRAIRESFGLSQDDFGVLLGGGKKAFARYENGRVMQARSMDNLLRVLKAYPQALTELRAETSSGGRSQALSVYQVSSSIRVSLPQKLGFGFSKPPVPSNLFTGAAA